MFLINPYILQASGNPLWNDLLAYYTADNTPNDALGNYNGTLTNGATYGTGIINNGFSFDGVNDYVDLGNNLDFDGSTPFSFSGWIKLNSSKQQCFISKEGGSSAYVGYIAQIESTNEVSLYLGSNFSTGDWLQVTSNDTLTTSTYHMITITYDGSKNASNIKIYIDGVSSTLTINRNTLTGSISNSINCNIGAAISSGAGRYFNGIIDEVGIWNRELTASEVTEIYNSGAGLQY
jgi:hypothetical protein